MSHAKPLAEQLKALENLQEIDLKIDQLTKQKQGIPAALKGADDQLAKLNAQLKTKSAALEELQKTERQTRAALDLNKDRQTRSASRLEAVQNSNEFGAVQKEIEQLNKMNLSLEEQLKKSAADIATAQKDVDGIQAQVQTAQGERDAQAQTLNGQSGQLDSQITALTGERGQFTSEIEQRMLLQYDRIRKARNGIGISLAIGGRCQACNMVVPPQMYNELHKGTQMHNCPSCHRILFIKKA